MVVLRGRVALAVLAPLALLGLLGLLAGCAQTTAKTPPGSTPITPTPSARLTWSPRVIPPGLTMNNYANSDVLSLAFSPANDHDGWLCEINGDGSFTIWATTDQARSWHIASHFTQQSTTQPPFQCTLTTDSVNPQILTLQFAWGCGACGTLSGAAYLSGDGGATWRPWSGHAGATALVTLRGTTFAIDGSALFASDPSLTTWRAVGPSDANPLVYLWPNRATGELLLADNANNVWRSADAGATWTKLALSVGGSWSFAEGGWNGASAWRVCNAQQCTTDLGQTWTATPDLPASASNAIDPCFPSAMTPDGSLYAACPPANSGATSAAADIIYRLAPGASAWRSLGAPPTSVASPFATPLGTPVDPSSQDVSQLIFSGYTPIAGTRSPTNTDGFDLWYSDPSAGILAVATLPS
jgi:hypothetical protein